MSHCSKRLHAARTTALLLVLLLLGSCAGLSSDEPLFMAADLLEPEELAAGDPAGWRVDIIGGQAPYSVSWDFAGAADGETQSFDSTAASGGQHSLSRALSMLAGDWTAAVSVTDSLGTVVHDSAAYRVAVAPQLNAQAVFAAGRIIVSTDTPGDSALLVVPSGPDLLRLGVPSYALMGGQCGASLTVAARDELNGAAGVVLLSLSDSLGRSLELSVPVAVAGTVRPDSLYVDFDRRAAGVGEPVTLTAYSGVLPEPFFKAYFALVLPRGARVKPQSFNVGAPGGASLAADGIWSGIADEVGLEQFDVPASFDELFWQDEGETRLLSFGMRPSAGQARQHAEGMLFNLRVSFSTPGPKRCYFIRRSGFMLNMTFYEGPGAEWSNWFDPGQGLWGSYPNNNGAAAFGTVEVR